MGEVKPTAVLQKNQRSLNVVTAAFDLLRAQRSHILLVLSNPAAGQEQQFRDWYQGACRDEVLILPEVLTALHYEQHEVDITSGEFPRLPFAYLGVYELSIDGAEAASPVLEHVFLLHRQQPAAQEPAAWLYFPASEKVGNQSLSPTGMLTIAFANSIAGREDAFREWYATRHIRHALRVPALASGQCFERASYQNPGAMDAVFRVIAVYEQVGSPKSIIESFSSLPAELFAFPTLDTSVFAEAVFSMLSDGCHDHTGLASAH